MQSGVVNQWHVIIRHVLGSRWLGVYLLHNLFDTNGQCGAWGCPENVLKTSSSNNTTLMLRLTCCRSNDSFIHPTIHSSIHAFIDAFKCRHHHHHNHHLQKRMRFPILLILLLTFYWQYHPIWQKHFPAENLDQWWAPAIVKGNL